MSPLLCLALFAAEDPAIAAARARQDELKSIDIVYRITETDPRSDIETVGSTGRLVIAGPKWRVEDNHPSGAGKGKLVAHKSHFVCDGTETRIQSGGKLLRGLINPPSRLVPGGRFLDPLTWTFNAIRPGSRQSLEWLKPTGKRVMHDGRECLEYSLGNDTALIDPGRGHVISRLGGTTVTYREVGGRWVPWTWTTGPTRDGKRTRTHTVEVVSLRVNEPVDDEVFRMTFPAGMKVHDQRDRDRGGLPIELIAGMNGILEPAVPPTAPEDSSRHWDLFWFVALLLACGLAVFLTRKRWSRPRDNLSKGGSGHGP
jgi:hypothetical protein